MVTSSSGHVIARRLFDEASQVSGFIHVFVVSNRFDYKYMRLTR